MWTRSFLEYVHKKIVYSAAEAMYGSHHAEEHFQRIACRYWEGWVTVWQPIWSEGFWKFRNIPNELQMTVPMTRNLAVTFKSKTDPIVSFAFNQQKQTEIFIISLIDFDGQEKAPIYTRLWTFWHRYKLYSEILGMKNPANHPPDIFFIISDASAGKTLTYFFPELCFCVIPPVINSTH